MSGQIAKESVNYRRASQRLNGGKRCASCSMYRELSTNGPGQCVLVAGNSYSPDVCDKWQAR